MIKHIYFKHFRRETYKTSFNKYLFQEMRITPTISSNYSLQAEWLTEAVREGISHLPVISTRGRTNYQVDMTDGNA